MLNHSAEQRSTETKQKKNKFGMIWYKQKKKSLGKKIKKRIKKINLVRFPIK
jgi:hypothetical protein